MKMENFAIELLFELFYSINDQINSNDVDLLEYNFYLVSLHFSRTSLVNLTKNTKEAGFVFGFHFKFAVCCQTFVRKKE